MVVWTRFRICLPNTCLTKPLEKGRCVRRCFPKLQQFKICGLCEVDGILDNHESLIIFSNLLLNPQKFFIFLLSSGQRLYALNMVFVKSLTSHAYQYILFTEYYLSKQLFCYTWQKSIPRIYSGQQRSRVFCNEGREKSISSHH